MTMFQEKAIVLNLPNQIQQALYHSFQKKKLYLTKAKPGPFFNCKVVKIRLVGGGGGGHQV